MAVFAASDGTVSGFGTRQGGKEGLRRPRSSTVVPRGTAKPLVDGPFVVGTRVFARQRQPFGAVRAGMETIRQTVAARQAYTARWASFGWRESRPKPVALPAQGAQVRARLPSFGAAFADRPARQIGSDGSRRPGIEMSPADAIARCSLGSRRGGQADSVGDQAGCSSDPARGGGSPRRPWARGGSVRQPERPAYRPGVRRAERTEPGSGRCGLRSRRREGSNLRAERSERTEGTRGLPRNRTSGRRQASWAPASTHLAPSFLRARRVRNAGMRKGRDLSVGPFSRHRSPDPASMHRLVDLVSIAFRVGQTLCRRDGKIFGEPARRAR
jgi:hypothetical protein